MKDPALITLQDVKVSANLFLQRYNTLGIIPVPIEEIGEKQLNLRIILLPNLIRDFGVNAFISQAFDSIIVDEIMYSKQPDRIRFTIAEETGHLFLHKDWYKMNGPKSIDNYIKWREDLDPTLFDHIERQAKTFAGMVLMPEGILLATWTEFARLHNLSTPCSAEQLPDTFPDLAQKFGVTPHSLLLRLSKEHLLTVSDGFWKALGYRKDR